jgi:hypothetical protein
VPHKQHNFKEKGVEHKMYVLISTTDVDWNTSHSRQSSARYHRSSCKVLVILIRFQWNLNLLTGEKYSHKNIMKMPSVGAELFHSDGLTGRRTDMTILRVAFRSFANTSNKLVVAPARTGSSFYYGPITETAPTCPTNQPSLCNSNWRILSFELIRVCIHTTYYRI